MPPQDFSGLTEDELKAMEGHERANVEARIKCLRNIQVLLDAAVMEMQQYSSVVGQLDMTSRMSRPTGKKHARCAISRNFCYKNDE